MTSKEYREKYGANDWRDKKRRRSPEHDAQVTFFAILDLNLREFPFLRFIFAVPNGAFFKSRKIAVDMKKEGLTPGVPDVCIPFARRGYGGAYMENKYGNNKMSKEQIEFRDHLISENYCFKNCYTTDQQIEFVEWYFNIELKRK